jgi:hypothetical protein
LFFLCLSIGARRSSEQQTMLQFMQSSFRCHRLCCLALQGLTPSTDARRAYRSGMIRSVFAVGYNPDFKKTTNQRIGRWCRLGKRPSLFYYRGYGTAEIMSDKERLGQCCAAHEERHWVVGTIEIHLPLVHFAAPGRLPFLGWRACRVTRFRLLWVCRGFNFFLLLVLFGGLLCGVPFLCIGPLH